MLQDLRKHTFNFFDQEKITRDLKSASLIEAELFPKIPVLKGLDVAILMCPAEQITGDCYDVLNLNNRNSLLYIADVAGHGMPAGLVSGIMNFLVYTLVQFYNSPKEIIVAANRILRQKIKTNIFITSVLANWDNKLNKLTYVQAGHEQIIHYQAQKRKAYLLPYGGIALGMISDIEKILVEQEVELAPDDVLFLYTDGIPEAWNARNQVVGMNKFLEIIEKKSVLANSALISQAVLNEIHEFMGDSKQKDDMTLIVLRKE
jgi:sigma-B regulation protein RsbU (phosphoserine phosphatase)